uniref:DekiORF131 n=1 Tax=Dendrolimus kikuchii nucleopolyhedrovirus TaxID=1219875 RepID=V9LT06_9ABAC|nr:DekiORF131 [Dendrolimus kikuchii nucleopolyhedrovirus]
MNSVDVVKRLFARSPRSLYSAAIRALVDSEAFEAQFANIIINDALPAAIKRDVMRTLFDGDRTTNLIYEDYEINKWPNITDQVLKNLLFCHRSSVYFNMDVDGRRFCEVVWKKRCDACGQDCNNDDDRHNNYNPPIYVSECGECGHDIVHDHRRHPRLSNEHLHEIVFNFDNWCQRCCVKPLFDIRWVDEADENYDCIRCVLTEIYHNTTYVDTLCDKYDIAFLYNRYRTIGDIENVINKSMHK